MNVTVDDINDLHNKTKNNHEPHKLNVGDIMEVHGWVMLEKIPEGKYRIKNITFIYGKPIYWFAKPKGTKGIIGHFAENVDPWVKDIGHPDLNKITKL